ncbi:MAG: FAD-dependent oxidoreductase [Deltaproteobacteria bacterium]|nr:FAD-dependent oxidoreductase [Deltaproteobacteria bacterium]
MRSLMGHEVQKVEDRTVGIVGSGPAGLAAAHDLLLLGFGVTIYETHPVLGGMLAVGIPEYRLPRDLIAAEVETIVEMGAKAVTSCRIGEDISLQELSSRHDAVIIAVGMQRSRGLPIEGGDAEGVIGGVDLLRDVSLGHPVKLGPRVVVIGGGNVAYDVGRTALRQTSADAARTALRDSGVSTVHLCSLETLEEMPADDIEIREGDEEGIIRRNALAPENILVNERGKVTGVEFKSVRRVYDEDGRFSPVFDDDVRETIECDTVLVAIGQSPDLGFLDGHDDVKRSDRGLIVCDPETGETKAPDVFVAGDLAYGPKLLIHAVASGKKVARAVYERLTGRRIEHDSTELHLSLPFYGREKDFEARGRIPVPTTTPDERFRSRAMQVETGYGEAEAHLEAGRCLDCGVNTIFDGEKCILCGGCVDVCPELCLRIVSVDRISGEDRLGEVIEGLSAGERTEDCSAILKDENICIRCALCAERCPTGAITMERVHFEERPTCRRD